MSLCRQLVWQSVGVADYSMYAAVLPYSLLPMRSYTHGPHP